MILSSFAEYQKEDEDLEVGEDDYYEGSGMLNDTQNINK